MSHQVQRDIAVCRTTSKSHWWPRDWRGKKTQQPINARTVYCCCTPIHANQLPTPAQTTTVITIYWSPNDNILSPRSDNALHVVKHAHTDVLPVNYEQTHNWL